MQEAGDILVESIYEECGFPTIGDHIMEQIKINDGVSIKDLINLLAYDLKACDAPRTIERKVEELVSEGKIIKNGDKLSIA